MEGRKLMGFKIRGLKSKMLFLLSLFTLPFSLFTVSFAAHPLITDDTGTQGKGKAQIEVNSEFTREKEREWDDGAGDWVTVKETGGEVATILSYGIIDNVDIVFGLPYVWTRTKVDGDRERESGISDVSLELKWRFFEGKGWSFALKPGILLPTGNERKGLGNGRASYAFTFITTKEIEPWAFHLNLGYAYNAYKLQADKEANRKSIWHVSLASEVEVVKDLKIVANIGVERNEEKGKNRHPAFILGGLIYSITKNFDLNAGIKGGLNKPETDLTILAGIALRF